MNEMNKIKVWRMINEVEILISLKNEDLVLRYDCLNGISLTRQDES